SYMGSLARRLGIRAERLPLGVATDTWPALPPRHRVDGTSAKLLHVGASVPVKGHRMLLETARNLREVGISFHIDSIGRDFGGIEACANSLGLSSHIRFHGFVPHREIRRFFENADLLLVTSHHEAGPIVALEAAVAGVPPIGTPVGHLLE